MLWAVHIPDGVFSEPWLVGGFAGAAALAALSVRCSRFREEDIARIALLAAAFFVASLIHVRVGPSSVHLLLNGLLGVVLGWQAALAIPVGLFLQAALFGHGGFTTLGVNSCVMVLPALLSWLLFNGLRRMPGVRSPRFRAILVAACVLTWTLSALYGLALFSSNDPDLFVSMRDSWANRIAFHPVTFLAIMVLAGIVIYLEQRLGNKPEFPLGLLVGEVAVLATVLLNCVVLYWGAQEDLRSFALVTFMAHLPLAVIEGLILGFVVGFLASVKPDLLGWVDSNNRCGEVPALEVRARADSQHVIAAGGRTAHVASTNLLGPPCPAPEFPGDPRPLQPGPGTSS
jgi:cobalt/nickel transport system permease protein